MTGTGGLMVRLGKVFQAFESNNVYIGDVSIGSASPDLDCLGNNGSFSELWAQFASNEQDLLKDLAEQRDAQRDLQGAWKTYLISLAKGIVIRQVDRDVTLVNDATTVNDAALLEALAEIIKQMVGAGSLAAETADNDVDASTVSVTTAAAATMTGANTGEAVLVGSVKRTDSRQNQQVFAEVVEVICTSDAQTDGSGRAETWSVTGESAVDILNYQWPNGSGAATTLTTVDASQDASGGNLLTNSDFESQTANIPDNWTLAVGTAGTTITTETSIIYGTHGAKAVKISGDGGGTLTAIYQTLTGLKPNTVYHGNVFVKDSGAGLLAGVITFSLTDGGGTVLTDDGGSNLSSTLAFGTTTATYASKVFTFVTPKALPTTGVRFKIAVTTALTSGESMYLDDLAFTEAREIYTGGPHLSIFAGKTNPIRGDKYTATVANDFSGEILQYFDRFFGMKALGLQLPSDAAGGETIADSLLS